MQLKHKQVFGQKVQPDLINQVVTATAKAAGFDLVPVYYNANGLIRVAGLRKASENLQVSK